MYLPINSDIDNLIFSKLVQRYLFIVFAYLLVNASVISLSESMINKTDLEKLQTPGSHEILVTYHNIKKTFKIEILQKNYV